ncbi:hypothetical protein Poli38472_004871 [Pythium oligandrum]|uniref:Uncharacterized protein n=1 Tax=Pythium oligandrum TaxID=41045 RepID=A0A8K1CCG6_PYTOL|nr:hypothetical protein Poli38472_004871 [Pythium oligandrum]|eukprot:TMW59802.1 hypothetical protein Poli38472_004871 [Pythium oligandrum]
MDHSVSQEELLPTLEESLDFLVALELDVSGVPAWQTGTTSDDSDSRRRHTAPLVKRTNRKVPQPNIREELTVLRATVAELEHTLSHLRPDLSRMPDRELVLAVWQDVGIRQKKHRQIAEEENARLRELLEQQMEVTTRLRQLLRKRKTSMVLSTLETTKRTRTANGLSQLAVVNALRMSMHQLYGHVDVILCNPRFQNDPTKPARSIQLHTSGSGAPYIEVVVSRVLPFHYRRTADAWWQFSRRREVDTLDWQTHTEIFRQSRS